VRSTAITSLDSSTTQIIVGVAPGIPADAAGLLLRDVPADRAELHALLHRGDGRDKPLHVFAVCLEDVEASR
jgi:hypothetical protein